MKAGIEAKRKLLSQTKFYNGEKMSKMKISEQMRNMKLLLKVTKMIQKLEEAMELTVQVHQSQLCSKRGLEGNHYG